MPVRKVGKKTKKTPSVPSDSNCTCFARLRMYRQGLGDCLLLSFGLKEDFSDASHILVDCGTLGATTTGVKMKDVVQNISDTTQKELAAVVGTHEHLDHLSGFNSQKPLFEKMKFHRAWLAWTEDASDSLAKKIAKYKGDLQMATAASVAALERVTENTPSGQRARIAADGIRQVLSFVGGDQVLPADVSVLAATFAAGVDQAMKYIAQHAGEVSYLQPGTVLQPEFLPGVNVYVLGPPRDPAKIANMGEHGNPELYQLSEATIAGFNKSVQSFKAATEGVPAMIAPDSPFDLRFRVLNNDPQAGLSSYLDPKESWRRIDSDWLQSSATLALQLDNQTNNTSLALAFELGDGGPVILLAADSQLGSWLSWHDYTWKVKNRDGSTRTVKAADLLKETVLYKVGHHSSHNATAKAHGLEMMTNDNLVCFIPLDGSVAKQKKWPMPAENLYKRLLERANNRVVRSDIGLPSGKKKLISGNVEINQEDLYFDAILKNG